LVSHGNGGNIAYRLPLAFNLLQSGVSVFLYDYEGYGASEGSPSIEAICKDGLSAYDYLIAVKKYQPANIIGYGESVGTGITSYIASQRHFTGIVLQSPYTSLIQAGCDSLPWLRLYPHFLFPKPELNNVEIFTHPHPPLLIIHGKRDSILSYHYSEQIMKRALPPAELVLLPHAGHNDAPSVDKDLLMPALKAFWKSLKED
jgi:hypothetical protein